MTVIWKSAAELKITDAGIAAIIDHSKWKQCLSEYRHPGWVLEQSLAIPRGGRKEALRVLGVSKARKKTG